MGVEGRVGLRHLKLASNRALIRPKFGTLQLPPTNTPNGPYDLRLGGVYGLG